MTTVDVSNLPNVHTIRLNGAPNDLPMLIRFCEEFALHEWLLTAVQDVIIPRAERDIDGGRDPLDSLLFALNELIPLWMPPIHLGPEMEALWRRWRAGRTTRDCSSGKSAESEI